MILWRGPIHPLPPSPGGKVDARRWTFEVAWGHLGFVEERRWSEDGHWTPCGYYAGLWLSRVWRWGHDWLEYDGPHDLLSLGFVQLSWQTERSCARHGW